MIINTGARTDTIQYYTDWLLNRFKENFVPVRNPLFPIKATRYDLRSEKVNAIQFYLKNYKPILPHITQIKELIDLTCLLTS